MKTLRHAPSEIKAEGSLEEGEPDLGKALARRCAEDDARAVVELLARRGLRPSAEIGAGLTAIEIAIHADAPKTFEALLKADKAAGGPGIKARLWGGSTPAHRCARWQAPEDEIDRGSPKCLAAALGMDPEGALRLNEAGLSTLHEAARGPSAECFRLALGGACAGARARGWGDFELARHLNQAAFCAVRAKLGPKELVARLDALDERGGSWRQALDENGSSVLARAASSSQEEALALLGAGADPMSPMSLDELWFTRQTLPCALAFSRFDMMLWMASPSLARGLLASLDDEKLASLGQALRIQGEAPMDLADARWLEYNTRLMTYRDVLGDCLMGRLAAVEEAKALSKVAEKARGRRGGSSL